MQQEFCIYAILCLILITGCETEYPRVPSESRTAREVFQKGDGLFAPHRSRSVDSALKANGMSDPLVPPFWEKQMQNSFIERAERLLSEPTTKTNKELMLFLHERLGLVYSAVPVKRFEKAVEHLMAAEQIALSDPETFKVYLALTYDHLTTTYQMMGQSKKALPYWHKLARDFQGVGVGNLKNTLSTMSVTSLARYYLQEENDTVAFEKHMKALSSFQGDDVQVTALYELYRVAKMTGDEITAQVYLERIKKYPESWETRSIQSKIEGMRYLIEEKKTIESNKHKH